MISLASGESSRPPFLLPLKLAVGRPPGVDVTTFVLAVGAGSGAVLLEVVLLAVRALRVAVSLLLEVFTSDGPGNFSGASNASSSSIASLLRILYADLQRS